MRDDVDVMIAGGGPAGLSLAASLGAQGVRVVCLEAQAPAEQGAEKFDGRTTAIATYGQALLDEAGVWPLLPDRACPIKRIRIADQRSAVHLDFAADEVARPAFGWILENRHLRAALWARLRALPSTTLLTPARLADFAADARGVTAVLADGRCLRARLLVGADGKNSFCRERAGIAVARVPYGQQALVATLAHTRDHHNMALELFLKGGPLALLPMTRAGKNFRSALVWSDDAAARLADWAEDDFLALVQRHVGAAWGDFRLLSPRRVYPLQLLHAQRYVAPRLALLGEAAHAMHPIAGQGFNLTLRDMAWLRDHVVDALRLGLDPGADTLLQAYERQRRPDNLAMLAATDGLDRLFSTSLWPVAAARRLGLRAVAALPPVKRFFMLQAMGFGAGRSAGVRRRLVA